MTTRTTTHSSLLAALTAMILWCNQTSGTLAAEKNTSGMAVVVTTVTINGKPKAVFDLITTARLWPQWHPATKGVGGVVERPYGLGDLIHERGLIADKDFRRRGK